MQSRDYLERMIQALTAAIARVAGFTAASQWEEAERALDEAWRVAFAFKRGDVARLDTSTLRALFGPKAAHAADLLAAEASLAEARGDSLRAQALAQKAHALRG